MKRDQRGWTLLEMLAVLALMALAITFALPALSDMAWNMQWQGAITSLVSLLERARGEAVRTNRPVTVTFSPAAQAVAYGTGPQKALALKSGVLRLTPGTAETEIIFFGDATSSGGEVVLCDDRGRLYRLTVEPGNGRCRIQRGNGQ